MELVIGFDGLHSPGLHSPESLPMSRLSTFRSALFDAVTHLLGYDCFITHCSVMGCRTDGYSFEFLPAFGCRRTVDGVELWGFGRHIVISRLYPQV